MGVVDSILFRGTDVRTGLPEPVVPRRWTENALDVGVRSEPPGSGNVVVVPQEHVSECGGDGEVGAEDVGSVCGREVRNTELFEGGLVENVVRVEDCGLVVLRENGGVGGVGEQKLGQEGEILGIPDVHVVNSHEHADAEEIADQVVDQSLEGEPQG